MVLIAGSITSFDHPDDSEEDPDSSGDTLSSEIYSWAEEPDELWLILRCLRVLEGAGGCVGLSLTFIDACKANNYKLIEIKYLNSFQAGFGTAKKRVRISMLYD
jgi:hypothetical protein